MKNIINVFMASIFGAFLGPLLAAAVVGLSGCPAPEKKITAVKTPIIYETVPVWTLDTAIADTACSTIYKYKDNVIAANRYNQGVALRPTTESEHKRQIDLFTIAVEKSQKSTNLHCSALANLAASYREFGRFFAKQKNRKLAIVHYDIALEIYKTLAAYTSDAKQRALGEDLYDIPADVRAVRRLKGETT